MAAAPSPGHRKQEAPWAGASGEAEATVGRGLAAAPSLRPCVRRLPLDTTVLRPHFGWRLGGEFPEKECSRASRLAFSSPDRAPLLPFPPPSVLPAAASFPPPPQAPNSLSSSLQGCPLPSRPAPGPLPGGRLFRTLGLEEGVCVAVGSVALSCRKEPNVCPQVSPRSRAAERQVPGGGGPRGPPAAWEASGHIRAQVTSVHPALR